MCYQCQYNTWICIDTTLRPKYLYSSKICGKCKHLHIGNKTPYFSDLYVSQWKLEKSNEFVCGKPQFVEVECDDHQMEQSLDEKYLGDIISTNGLNIKNILARKSRGIVISNQICSFLDEVCFGHFKFEFLIQLKVGS